MISQPTNTKSHQHLSRLISILLHKCRQVLSLHRYMTIYLQILRVSCKPIAGNCTPIRPENIDTGSQAMRNYVVQYLNTRRVIDKNTTPVAIQPVVHYSNWKVSLITKNCMGLSAAYPIVADRY